ncbi:hypothetical protein CHUAL_003566 [Chamberlinius hualienensis]
MSEETLLKAECIDYWKKPWKLLRLSYFFVGIDINPTYEIKNSAYPRLKSVYLSVMFILMMLSFVHRMMYIVLYVVPAIWTDNTSFFHLGIFIANSSATITFVIQFFKQKQITRFYRQLIDNLYANYDRGELTKFTKKWFKYQIVCLITISSFVVFATFLRLYHVYPNLKITHSTNRTNLKIPIMGHTLTNNDFVTMMLDLYTVQPFVPMYLFLFTFSWTCSMLEFAIMAIRLPKVPEDDRIALCDVDQELQSFQQQHNRVCQLIKTANELYSLLNLATALCEMGNLILVITVSKSSETIFHTSMYICIISAVLHLISRNSFGAKVNNAVCDSLNSVKSINLFGNIPLEKRRFPTQVQLEFQLYSVNLHLNKPSLSCWGVLVFKKGLIITVSND